MYKKKVVFFVQPRTNGKRDNCFPGLRVSAKENYFEGLPRATSVIASVLMATHAF